MTAEETALKAAIAADPADDTSRLALADYWAENGRPDLEWNEREVVAVRPVLDDPEDDQARLEFADFCDLHGRHARATWVRLALQLARKPPCPDWCDHNPERCDRAALERDIKTASLDARVWTPVSGSCLFVPGGGRSTGIEGGDWSTAYVRRGFAETVVCHGDWWVRNAPDLTIRHPVARCILRTPPDVGWGDPKMFRREPMNNVRRLCWFLEAPHLTAEVDGLLFPDQAVQRIQYGLLRTFWPKVNFTA